MYVVSLLSLLPPLTWSPLPILSLVTALCEAMRRPSVAPRHKLDWDGENEIFYEPISFIYKTDTASKTLYSWRLMKELYVYCIVF